MWSRSSVNYDHYCYHWLAYSIYFIILLFFVFLFFYFSRGHPKKIKLMLIHGLQFGIFKLSNILYHSCYLFSQLKRWPEANNQPHIDCTAISNQCTNTLIMHLACKSIVRWVFQADSTFCIKRIIFAIYSLWLYCSED